MYAHKRFYGERLPLFHDGFIGLGNCKMTLIDQWIQQNLICQNIVGICIAKVIPQRLVGTRVQIDYVSIGVDFKEKYKKRIWLGKNK